MIDYYNKLEGITFTDPSQIAAGTYVLEIQASSFDGLINSPPFEVVVIADISSSTCFSFDHSVCPSTSTIGLLRLDVVQDAGNSVEPAIKIPTGQTGPYSASLELANGSSATLAAISSDNNVQFDLPQTCCVNYSLVSTSGYASGVTGFIQDSAKNGVTGISFADQSALIYGTSFNLSVELKLRVASG